MKLHRGYAGNMPDHYETWYTWSEKKFCGSIASDENGNFLIIDASRQTTPDCY